MSYVDGFVLPVPLDRLDDYKKMARKAGKIWMELGALAYSECVADDVKPGETVVFSWIVYENKRARDRIMKKVMEDPRLAEFMDPKKLPFDGKRMFFGGFKPIVEM
jgi:uncharacterized protein YbaA (DUF1428 family)